MCNVCTIKGRTQKKIAEKNKQSEIIQRCNTIQWKSWKKLCMCKLMRKLLSKERGKLLHSNGTELNWKYRQFAECAVCLAKRLLKEHFDDDFLLVWHFTNYETNTIGIAQFNFGSSCFCRSVLFDWLDNILAAEYIEIRREKASERERETEAETCTHTHACTHIKLPKWWKTRNPISHVYFIVNKTYASCVQQHHIATIITTGNGHHFELIPYCFTRCVCLRVCAFFVLRAVFFFLFIICLRGPTHLMKYERITWKRRKRRKKYKIANSEKKTWKKKYEVETTVAHRQQLK